MADISVLGIGMTPQGRSDRTPDDLAAEAAQAALDDAGLRAHEVARVVVANALGGLLGDQEMIRGQVWLRRCGFGQAPIVNVDNACAGGATALELATLAVQAGESPVLVVGVEKMWVGDRSRRVAALEQGLAAADRPLLRQRRGDAASVLLAVNARWAQEQMDERGATRTQFAATAAKSYRHASLNPLAQHRTAHSAADVLGSAAVAGPLTRLMCSSFTDGAAALVLRSSAGGRAPRVRASVLLAGDGSLPYHDRLAAVGEEAWKAAGVGPKDLSAIELHDVTSAEELYALEALQFFGAGEAGPAAAAGHTSLGGGRLVVNPSGGLVARGHPIGATGVCQVVELALQLRGEAGARQVEPMTAGAAVNAGGMIDGDAASIGITVLERG